VLVELLDVPAEGDALARLRAVAAAGGPHVQRLLALSDDGAMVTYEVCEGTTVDRARLAAMDAATAAALEDAERAVTAVRLGDLADTPPRSPLVVQTPGGAVVLVVEAIAADSGERP
jgi:xanthine/CO dehydrogenase XdhC/CoxF family maturation factor